MYYGHQPQGWGDYGESFAQNALEDDEAMDNEEMEDEQTPGQQAAASLPYCSERLSMEEYEKQAKEFTRKEVDQLVRSPQYQKRLNTCSSCWCNWLEGQVNDVCMECGGHALSRPCPICEGRCGAVWKRDVEMSHSSNEAHWNGSCGLPEEQQKLFMLKLFQDDSTEDSVTEAMEDLAT